MSSIRETRDLFVTMKRVHEGLLVATSLTNISFLNNKQDQLYPSSFPSSYSSEGVTISQVCIGLLEVIGNVDSLIESSVQSFGSLCKLYQPPETEHDDYEILLQDLVLHYPLNNKAKEKTQSNNFCEIQSITKNTSENIEVLEEETSYSLSSFLEKRKEEDVVMVLVNVVESLWLIQFLINTLLGITLSDLKQFEKQKHNKMSQKKKKKKPQKTAGFSKNVLQLVASKKTEVKTLFTAGLPRCLRIRSVLYALHTWLLACMKTTDMTFPLFRSVENKPPSFFDQADQSSFELSSYLTQIGLVILAEDISCDFIRSTALSGLELLCFSQDEFGIELLLIGLRKAQLDGSFIGDIKKIPKTVTQNTSPAIKSKRVSGFRCSIGKKQMVGEELSKLANDNQAVFLENNFVPTSYSCSHCQTRWYNVKRNDLTPSKCLICEKKILHVSSSTNDTYSEYLTDYGWTSPTVVTFFVSPSDYMTHELENIGPQLSCVITCLRHQLSFQHLYDIFLKPLNSGLKRDPTQLKQTNETIQKTPEPHSKNITAQFSFPPHGWLLRVLEESKDPAVRQGSFNLISQVLTSHASNVLVAELRFKVHLPIFRGLWDSDFQVVESAIKSIVAASKLAPLKDGAVHRLVAFFSSTSRKLWSFIFLRFFEPCYYHDASAIRVLIKGIIQVFLREFNSLKQITFPFSYFELYLPTTNNVWECINSFYLENTQEASDNLLVYNTLSYWLAASLRLFYMLGLRHSSHFTTISQFYGLEELNNYALQDLLISKNLQCFDITAVALQSLCAIGFMIGCALIDQTLLKFNTCFCLKCWEFYVRNPCTLLDSKYRVQLFYKTEYTNV